MTNLIPNVLPKGVALQLNVSSPRRTVLFTGTGWWFSSQRVRCLSSFFHLKFLHLKNWTVLVRRGQNRHEKRRGRVPFVDRKGIDAETGFQVFLCVIHQTYVRVFPCTSHVGRNRDGSSCFCTVKTQGDSPSSPKKIGSSFKLNNKKALPVWSKTCLSDSLEHFGKWLLNKSDLLESKLGYLKSNPASAGLSVQEILKFWKFDTRVFQS